VNFIHVAGLNGFVGDIGDGDAFDEQARRDGSADRARRQSN